MPGRPPTCRENTKGVLRKVERALRRPGTGCDQTPQLLRQGLAHRASQKRYRALRAAEIATACLDPPPSITCLGTSHLNSTNANSCMAGATAVGIHSPPTLSRSEAHAQSPPLLPGSLSVLWAAPPVRLPSRLARPVPRSPFLDMVAARVQAARNAEPGPGHLAPSRPTHGVQRTRLLPAQARRRIARCPFAVAVGSVPVADAVCTAARLN